MKKSTKITLISLAALAVLAGIGGTFVAKTEYDKLMAHVEASRAKTQKEAEKKKQEEKMTTKEKQIAFLKEHEQEMVDYVKSQNPEITTVKFDWDSINVETAGNGTPQGGGEVLLIFGYANGSDLTNFSLNFSVDKNHMPILDSIGSDNLHDI